MAAAQQWVMAASAGSGPVQNTHSLLDKLPRLGVKSRNLIRALRPASTMCGTYGHRSAVMRGVNSGPCDEWPATGL